MFYSWPSQGHWYKYRADEQNVAASVDQLKSFLLAVAEETHADTINLVAHSMGNRVLTGALQYGQEIIRCTLLCHLQNLPQRTCFECARRL